MKSKVSAKSSGAGSTPSGASAPKKLVKKESDKSAAAQKRAPKSVSAKAADAKDSAVSTAKSAQAASGQVVRATKKRAPKDLAAQYGETAKAPRKTAVEKAPRKRRDAAARARLKEVIAPDDALLARLARAGAISSSLAPGVAMGVPSRVVKTRRSRQWEAHCGKCGKSAFYSASAALCAGCGAILVRE